jgi:hypothetical protein
MIAAMRESKAHILAALASQGQNTSGVYLYPNYALAPAPVENVYGPNNTERLKAIAMKYDPGRVMTRQGGYVARSHMHPLSCSWGSDKLLSPSFLFQV